MTITELIGKINKIKKKYGDIKVDHRYSSTSFDDVQTDIEELSSYDFDTIFKVECGRLVIDGAANIF